MIGGGFGDPHVTTLDLTTYTFNGWGEYILVDISDDDTPFQLQCRTDRAIFKDGTISDATIYSGFAARAAAEYGTLLQVELNDERDGKTL